MPLSKFEVCNTCQYKDVSTEEEPCSICRRLYYDKYEPTEEEIKEEDNKTIIKYRRFPDRISLLDDNNEYTGIVPTSRYQVLRVVIEDEDTYLEGYNQLVVPESSDDIYHVVREKEVNRLDIISNEYYQTPYFWWAIALANNFVDPFVVNEGVMLRIPAVATLYDPRNQILDRTRRRGLWQS